jgi:pSer/pThr/pTyr-binding forkhead associated (FHA) protein
MVKEMISTISSKHCIFSLTESGLWVIYDKNSKNGTFLSCQTEKTYEARHTNNKDALKASRKIEIQNDMVFRFSTYKI